MNRRTLSVAWLLFTPAIAMAQDFVRGDADGDGFVTLNDVAHINAYAFGGPLGCLDAADVNDDGVINAGDSGLLTNHVLGRAAGSPSAPYPDPGPDSTADDLDCGLYPRDESALPPAPEISVRVDLPPEIEVASDRTTQVDIDVYATFGGASLALFAWSAEIRVEGPGFQAEVIDFIPDPDFLAAFPQASQVTSGAHDPAANAGRQGAWLFASRPDRAKLPEEEFRLGAARLLVDPAAGAVDNPRLVVDPTNNLQPTENHAPLPNYFASTQNIAYPSEFEGASAAITAAAFECPALDDPNRARCINFDIEGPLFALGTPGVYTLTATSDKAGAVIQYSIQTDDGMDRRESPALAPGSPHEFEIPAGLYEFLVKVWEDISCFEQGLPPSDSCLQIEEIASLCAPPGTVLELPCEGIETNVDGDELRIVVDSSAPDETPVALDVWTLDPGGQRDFLTHIDTFTLSGVATATIPNVADGVYCVFATIGATNDCEAPTANHCETTLVVGSDPNADFDGDGIVDSLDLMAAQFSDAFGSGGSPGTLYGTVTDRAGNDVTARPNGSGVEVFSSGSGGTTRVEFVDGPVVIELESGTTIVVRPSSVILHLVEGQATARIPVAGADSALVVLAPGDEIRYDPERMSLTNQGASPLTLSVDRKDVVLEPGATLELSGAGGGLQRPGDCNQDGTIDLSDGICLLGHLFNGSPANLPCGDGLSTSPGNLALADSNGDGQIDLSDGVHVFGYLFVGGPPHTLGMECVTIDTCPDACGG